MKAARALLGWSQANLAKRAGYALPTLNLLERGIGHVRDTTLADIRQTFEQAGVQFLDANGVRLVKEVLNIRMLEGRRCLQELYDDIYQTLKNDGGTLLLTGVDERPFLEFDPKALQGFISRVHLHHNIHLCILYRDGDTYFPPSKAGNSEYRWISSDLFGLVPMYIYADKYAVVVWGDPVRVVITHNPSLAETFRRQFLANWALARHIPMNILPNTEPDHKI